MSVNYLLHCRKWFRKFAGWYCRWKY